MSFRSLGAESGRAFECVRRSLLQRDGLPFADVLTAKRLAAAFEADGVEFGDAADPDVIYTPPLTFWAFLSQMLFTGEQRSCVAAVARVAAVEALRGRVVSDTNTGAYCRARCQIPEAVPQRLTRELACDCESQLPSELRWRGRRTFLVDGTTFSMPDTPENQAEYPQSPSQAEGLGFPTRRAVALISLTTAMVCGQRESTPPTVTQTQIASRRVHQSLPQKDCRLRRRQSCHYAVLHSSRSHRLLCRCRHHR